MTTRLALAALLAGVGTLLGASTGFASSVPPSGAGPCDVPAAGSAGSVPASSVAPAPVGAPDGSGATVPDVTGTWCVASIGGIPVGDVVASVELADGAVHGRVANTFNGTYTLGDGTIEFGPIMTTLMMGPPEEMEVEAGLMAALVGSQPFGVDGDVLTIGSGAGAVVLQRAAVGAASDTSPEATSGVVTVSGTVTYRERVALPEGALLTVQVLDVSRADAPADVVAEAVITPTGQVPIPYAIAVSPSAFEAGHTYSLSASITVGGDPLFTSADHLAVTAEPAAQTIDVVLVQATR